MFFIHDTGTSCVFYHHLTDQQQFEVWKILPQNPAQTRSSRATQFCPSPSCPSITDFFECLSVWQFWRLPEQYCSQEYHRGFSAFSQCQIKPAVFMTALQERQVLSTLHKWTKIAEDPRVPATKFRSSSEEKVVIPHMHNL